MANLGYVQVTRRCNQCCRFCSNPELDLDIAPADARARVDELAAAGYAGVIFTGGEPTLHDALPELIAHAVAAGLPPRIVTNGQRIGTDPGLARELAAAGLRHLHLSLYSHRREVVAELTGVSDSLDHAWAALERLGEVQPGITVDLNTVICRANADHLDRLVETVVTRFGFVHHVVFNNLDPFMNRVAQHPDTVPTLGAFELSLHRALRWLAGRGCTARVERVPLCYLSWFEHLSTETRKIVKAEERTTHFLDDKGRVRQTGFLHHKAEACGICLLGPLCAGLDGVGHGFDPEELYPVFVDPAPIAGRILGVGRDGLDSGWLEGIAERQRRVPPRRDR